MKYISMQILFCLGVVIPSVACEKSGKRKSDERKDPTAKGMQLRSRKIVKKEDSHSDEDDDAFVQRLFGNHAEYDNKFVEVDGVPKAQVTRSLKELDDFAETVPGTFERFTASLARSRGAEFAAIYRSQPNIKSPMFKRWFDAIVLRAYTDKVSAVQARNTIYSDPVICGYIYYGQMGKALSGAEWKQMWGDILKETVNYGAVIYSQK